MKELYEEDEDFVEIWEKCSSWQPTRDFRILDKFPLKGSLLYVPKTFLREKVIRDLHKSRLGGHFGRDKTIDSVDERYYWPQIGKDVATIRIVRFAKWLKGNLKILVCMHPCPSPKIVGKTWA